MTIRDQLKVLDKNQLLREAIQKVLKHGCGNNLCKFAPPKGQATNGPCSCAFQLRKLVEGK
jgi:hypothetical protein